jgi:hypothetical protein
MLQRYIEKYGHISLNFTLSFFCIVASVMITFIVRLVISQNDLVALYAASIICPLLIAPFVISKLLSLTVELNDKKNDLLKLNEEQGELKNR